MSKSADKEEYKEIREKGSLALATAINQEQNICIVEKYVHKQGKKAAKEAKNKGKDTREAYEKRYTKVLFQTVGDIIKGTNLKQLVKNIKQSMVGWDHPDYTDVKRRIEEQDDFIINPFEVEEGVTKCHCGSERVFTYSKQERGGDEPMTTHAKCVKCKAQWSYSG